MPYDDSLFASPTVHEKQVEMADGSTHTCWFKELTAVAFRSYQIAEHSADPDERVASMAKLVASSLCEPDGHLSLTLEKAKTLKPDVMNRMVMAILEINNIGGRAKNP
jgi:hypothetical protein